MVDFSIACLPELYRSVDGFTDFFSRLLKVFIIINNTWQISLLLLSLNNPNILSLNYILSLISIPFIPDVFQSGWLHLQANYGDLVYHEWHYCIDSIPILIQPVGLDDI